ncbi:hypothetical protein DL93DRAFT_1097022 [Clavulina sp. PMI_390]|nr:hypothetical protein DL93DRAFT_1097022 [Clavulina sp. PMI_390]
MSTAGSSAGGMDFGDFQVVRNMVANNTVDRLKAIIASLNTALHLGISKSGRKAELIAAVQTQLDRLRNSPQQLDRWLTARRIIKGDASAPPTATATTTAAPTTPGAGTSSTAYYAPPKIHASPGGGTSSPSSSSWARTTLPPPRTPASSSSSGRPCKHIQSIHLSILAKHMRTHTPLI